MEYACEFVQDDFMPQDYVERMLEHQLRTVAIQLVSELKAEQPFTIRTHRSTERSWSSNPYIRGPVLIHRFGLEVMPVERMRVVMPVYEYVPAPKVLPPEKFWGSIWSNVKFTLKEWFAKGAY